MIKKANIQWTARQLSRMLDKRNLNFDNAIQRSYIWDLKRQSLLIHSMIAGYPIPPFFTIKTDNGTYSCLDGRQRSTTIKRFLNDEFLLTDVPEIETEEGIIDVNGLKFSELSEDIQEEINGYSLTIYFFDSSITPEEINELFFRLNNGKPLSAIELTRTRAKSFDAIRRLSKHDLFNTFTDKAISRYANEDIVIKAWNILYNDNKSLETKDIRPVMETAEITEQQETEISQVLARINEAYTIISISDDKHDKKVAKRMLTRTHLLSIVPVTLDSNKNNIAISDYIVWVKDLLSGIKSATNIEAYNDNASSGSAKAEAVKQRLQAVREHYNKFMKTI